MEGWVMDRAKVSTALFDLFAAAAKGEATDEYRAAGCRLLDAIPESEAHMLAPVYETVLQICGGMLGAINDGIDDVMPMVMTPFGPVPLDQAPDPVTRWVGRFIAAGLRGDHGTTHALWQAADDMTAEQARMAGRALSSIFGLPLAVVPKFLDAGKPLTHEFLQSLGEITDDDE